MTSHSKTNGLFAALAARSALAAGAVLGTLSLQAQSAPTNPSAIARYDKDGNGVLDATETAAMRADEAKATAAVVTNDAATQAKDRDVLTLNPFEVVTDKDDGFVATNAGTATKLGLDMRDLAAPYSVMTGEFIAALGITDLQEAVLWSTNGSPVIDGQGADQFNAPVMYNVRGALQNVGQQQNFFTTASIGDTYNTERIDFGRGPNAVLFNTGASDVLGGGISATTKRARFDRNAETIALLIGSWDNYRVTLDVNRKLTDKLSVRMNGVWHDKKGWMDYEFEKRKGISATGTYRFTQKTEMNLDISHDKIARTRPTYPAMDRLSGWDGVTVFDGPITNAMFSSTATPGVPNAQGRSLSFNGEPQGVNRQGNSFVYIPGTDTIMNWLHMGFTRRADDTSRVPLYSGGRAWSRNGDANLLPFGNASNQSNTPGVNDNGTANGPTILYSESLPDDRFDHVIANSKFRLPSKRSTNMFDDPQFTQWTKAATLGFRHRFSESLFFEATANYNQVHNFVRNNINGLRDTVIDLNRNLPNGQPNPYFLTPYGQAGLRTKDFYIDNAGARANLNYIKDLRKWGNYAFSLTGHWSKRQTDGRQQVLSLATLADPREWSSGAQEIQFREYWGATSRSFTPANGAYPTTLFNRVADAAGNNYTTSTTTFQPRWVLNSYDDNTRKTMGGVAALVGRYFDNKLVLTAGTRKDSSSNRVRQAIRQGSKPNDPNWDGYTLDDRYWRPDAPADWNELTYIPLSANGTPTTKVPLPANTRPTITGSNGVNAPDPRYAGVRFKDDYNNPVRKGNSLSHTFGLTYHVLPWMSAKLNYGTNFAIRDAGTFFIDGTDADPETGVAYEGALTFNLFRGKLHVSPRYYHNERQNRLGNPPTTGPINNLLSRNDYTDNLTESRNTLGFINVPGQDYFKSVNTGYELEISGKVYGVRISGSLGTAKNTDTGRWQNTQAYVLGRADEFRQVLERAGGILDTTQKNPNSTSAPGLAIPNPNISDTDIVAAGGNPTERANAVNDYNSIWQQYDNIPLLRDTVGTDKLNWKLLVDYTFQEGRLRGLRIGGAVSYVDRQLAGYRSADTLPNPNYNPNIPTSTTNRPWIDDPSVDLNTPIWVDQPFEVTGTFGYTRRLRTGWRVLDGKEISFNLIVRNITNWQKVLRQDTGLALRPPNGDLSAPNRVSVPSRVGSFQRPISFELTTTLRL